MSLVQERFLHPSGYDSTMAGVFASYEQLPLILLSHLKARLGDRAHVMDAGCGTGTALAAFAAHQPGWSFVGVDPAEPMLAIARMRLSEAGLAGRVELVRGSVGALPEGARFDAATSILVEHLLPDDGTKLGFLQEIARRVSPGGWIVLAGLHGDLGSGLAQRGLQAWMDFVALRGLPSEAQEMIRRRATEEDSIVSEDRIRGLLGEAGFVEVEKILQVHLLGAWMPRRDRR